MGTRTIRQYNLKVSSKFYEPIKDGRQKFIIKFDEYDFKVGDVLTLQECKPITKSKLEFTGETIVREITATLRGCKGLQRGYVVLGLDIKEEEIC